MKAKQITAKVRKSPKKDMRHSAEKMPSEKDNMGDLVEKGGKSILQNASAITVTAEKHFDFDFSNSENEEEQDIVEGNIVSLFYLNLHSVKRGD